MVLFASVSIESTQLIIGRIFDIDDIILNIIGGMLGYGIYFILQKIGEEDKILYEKSLKITEEDSKIVVVIFFKVKEDITDYQPIKEEVQPELDEES